MSRHLISVDEALSLVWEHAPTGFVERVALHAALGRRLAQSITSDIDSPPHDKSIVDGFAVRTADLPGGNGELRVIEAVMAGMTPQREVQGGQATRIMTGASVPRGADAVVMIERTNAITAEELARVHIDEPSLRAGQNIVRQGAVMRRGDVVIEAGRRLRSIEIGLLAEVGCVEVPVYRRPSVAVLATGNELVPHEVTPAAGQIRNSNGPMLAAAVQGACGMALELPIGRDDADQLTSAIQEGLDADILLISGGVSAGDLDLAPCLLCELGVEEIFHKVQLKPGKPLWFGVQRGQRDRLVFGLPGNPVSSLVCFLLFVRPAMERFQGAASREVHWQRAQLSTPYRQRGPRAAYVPARQSWTSDGAQVAILPSTGSGDLRALTDANALAHFPPGDNDFATGVWIDVLPLDVI